MSAALRSFAAWLAGLLLLAWRLTCRYRVDNDPRPALRAAGTPYVYALLHAHQLAAVFVNDERRLAAMVSRSADGDLLVPSLRLRRVLAVRGSTRKQGIDKGGRAALDVLAGLLRERVPALLAVDGPRGPRNHVHRGVIDVAVATGAVVLPTVVVASRRWILGRTWDRFQLPKPFAEVTLAFGEALRPDAADPEQARDVLARLLCELEAQYDADEHALALRQPGRRASA